MPAAMFILLGCQLIGEVVRAAFHLPIPGPVIGMFLLAAGLAWRQRGAASVGPERARPGYLRMKGRGRMAGTRPAMTDGYRPGQPRCDSSHGETALERVSDVTPLERVSHATPLERTADALISHMGLLFVPAGVGVIAEVGLLRTQWFPILAALVGSTMLSLMVTGLVMHWVGRAGEARATPVRMGQAKLEARS
jgi:holin-like protein